MLIAANLTKATLKKHSESGGGGSGQAFEVMFNPNTLSFDKSIPWNEQTDIGKDKPKMQFTSGKGYSLTLELFFDTLEDNKSCKDDVKKVTDLGQIDGDAHRPPIVEFVWGSAFQFVGVINSIGVKYTLFLENGDPVRATITMKMIEADMMDKGPKSSPPNSPDRAKLRTLKRGETLHAIAAVEYDDPSEWRRIADANGIDDPLNLKPGQKLLIPPIIR